MSRIQEFDYSVNLLRAIIWQYDKSPNLFSLVQRKQDWYNTEHALFWESWYDDVFNLLTANEFGLAVWALILDVPTFADNGASPSDYPAFGFDPYGESFTNGNFATGGSGIVLPIDERRALLRLRWHQITTDGSIPSLNAAIADVFGPGAGYIVDNNDMTIDYNFVTPISAPLQAVLETLDVLPRPAGVQVTIVNP